MSIIWNTNGQIVDNLAFGDSESLASIPRTNGISNVPVNKISRAVDGGSVGIVDELNPKPMLTSDSDLITPNTSAFERLPIGLRGAGGSGGSALAARFQALKNMAITSGVNITQYLQYFKPTVSKYTWIQFEMEYDGIVMMPPKDSYDVQDFASNITRSPSKYHVLGVAPTLTRWLSNDTEVTITFRANSAFWDFLMNLMQDEVGVIVNAYFLTYDAGAPKKGMRAGFIKGMELGNYEFLKVGAADEFQLSQFTFSAAECRTVVFPSMY